MVRQVDRDRTVFSIESAGSSDIESEIRSGSAGHEQAYNSNTGPVYEIHGNSVPMCNVGMGPGAEEDTEERNLEYSSAGIEAVVDKNNINVVSSWFQEDSVNSKRMNRPYKREAIEEAVEMAMKDGEGRRDSILSNLKLMGITAFIIDAHHATTTSEIMEHVYRVIGFVRKENRTFAPAVFQRCLLFQDNNGLLYNLTLPRHCSGLANKWHENVETFSAFQATIAFAILMRSFPCAQEDGMLEQLQPVSLALILGLVLTEEISMSWTNAVMMVRACPSISACSVTGDTGSDWIRKLILFALALSGAAEGTTQVVLVMISILLACIALLANLGSRAWYFFQWQPLSYNGPFVSVVAYMAAVGTGFAVPLLGHRTASLGGKPAIESILRLATLLAVSFILSDLAGLQTFLIIGKTGCSQDAVNTFAGIWLALTLLVSVVVAGRVAPNHQYPEDEPFLVEDHQSPVGYKVPILPDQMIIPLTQTGIKLTGMPTCSINFELFLGVLLACLIGAATVSLSFTDWKESAESSIAQILELF